MSLPLPPAFSSTEMGGIPCTTKSAIIADAFRRHLDQTGSGCIHPDKFEGIVCALIPHVNKDDLHGLIRNAGCTDGAVQYQLILDYLFGKRAPLQSPGSMDRPVIILHNIQHNDNIEGRTNMRHHLRGLLDWAVPLSPSEIQIIELRIGYDKSMIPELMRSDDRRFEDVVQVMSTSRGISPDLSNVQAPRALVCSGVLEHSLYPCHDLRRGESHVEVGIVPQCCGASGRSGELMRANTFSHLEEVLGVKILLTMKDAVKWLHPAGPPLTMKSSGRGQSSSATGGMTIFMDSGESAQLTDAQRGILGFLLPADTSEVKLSRIGRGYSRAVKFFCSPVTEVKNVRTTCATTFLKFGPESEIESELRVTQHMVQVLGSFCPQILGYAELGEEAALHLSLADLGDRQPRDFVTVYMALMSSAGTEDCVPMLERVKAHLDFVFENLIGPLHTAKAPDVPDFSVADELGLCKDLPDGMTGLEECTNMSSGWVLQKLWGKSPGDGGLASSARLHIEAILGKAASLEETLSFVDGHPLVLPNICSALLEQPQKLCELRELSTSDYLLCFVHGDLHGENIMVDKNDNKFLIDFGKTGIGHCLEDVTWLESFIILSYTDIETEEELRECLNMVHALAPPEGLTTESCSPEAMERELLGNVSSPRMVVLWGVLKCLRSHLRMSLTRNLAQDDDDLIVQRENLVATLLLMRNALFFLSARENKDNPNRRRVALALACAYANTANVMCESVMYLQAASQTLENMEACESIALTFGDESSVQSPRSQAQDGVESTRYKTRYIKREESEAEVRKTRSDAANVNRAWCGILEARKYANEQALKSPAPEECA